MKKLSRAAKKPAAKTAGQAGSKKASFYETTRTSLESMYFLHIFLLLLMTSLSAALIVIMFQQRYQIENLKFKLEFYSSRYEWEKGQNGREYAVVEASPSPSPNPQVE